MSLLYLYAITSASTSLPEGLTGIKKEPVRPVSEGDVMAIVSSAPEGRLRPRRRNLKAHHEVIKRVAETETLLPMAFGVVAESPDQVRTYLSDRAGLLVTQLNRLSGHVEIGVRLTWDVDDIFAHFVSQYDELRELRDAFFGEEGSASRQQMIQLGERFDALLDAERDAHRTTLETHLEGVCQRLVADDPRDETEAANLSCLVARSAIEDFESAIQRAASDFDDVFTLTYTDPLAPYSFAEVSFE
jgi:hypothetical protein